MNRVWIISICIILIIAVGGVLFLYNLKENRSAIALSGNVYEFNKLTGFSEVSLTYLDNESFAINTGLKDFDQLNSHFVKSTTKSFTVNTNDGSIDINVSLNGADNQAISSRSDNTPRVNLTNKDFLFYIFRSTNTWNGIISQKRYTVVSNTTTWEISIDPESIKDLMSDALKFYSVNYLELQGSKTFDLSKLKISDFTAPNVTITIDKTTNLMTQFSLIINADTLIDFGVSLKDIDPGQTATEKISIKYGKGYQLIYKVNTLKFTSGYKKFQNLQFLDEFALNNISF